jgi:5,10-methylenetetrahydrofolate reductase
MKVTDLWSAGQKPTVSFELFPPRSPKGAEKLEKAIDALADLRPDFVSVTFGAGGSTREGSRQLVEKLKKEKMLEVVAYFYDNRYFFDFVQRCRALDIGVPILAGVMPIYSVKMMNMLADMCGATITDEVRDGMASLPEDDKEALANFGIEFATSQCRELLDAGVPGLHFYTMDLSTSTVGIVNRLRDDGLL